LSNSLHYLNDRLAVWSQKTFGSDAERGPQGPANHLKREAVELAAEPFDETECADCLILVLDINRRAGRSLEQLLGAALTKQFTNEGRQWGEEDAEGVSEHVRTE
jgi:hypothetical protein